MNSSFVKNTLMFSSCKHSMLELLRKNKFKNELIFMFALLFSCLTLLALNIICRKIKVIHFAKLFY